jgi:hypothetical protein
VGEKCCKVERRVCGDILGQSIGESRLWEHGSD